MTGIEPNFVIIHMNKVSFGACCCQYILGVDAFLKLGFFLWVGFFVLRYLLLRIGCPLPGSCPCCQGTIWHMHHLWSVFRISAVPPWYNTWLPWMLLLLVLPVICVAGGRHNYPFYIHLSMFWCNLRGIFHSRQCIHCRWKVLLWYYALHCEYLFKLVILVSFPNSPSVVVINSHYWYLAQPGVHIYGVYH